MTRMSRSLMFRILALGLGCGLAFFPLIQIAEAGYGEGAYYAQSGYYAQSTYYAQSSYSGGSSATYSEPGTWEFIVPAHSSITVQVWGGGGGGGGDGNSGAVDGSSGGASIFAAGQAAVQASSGGGGAATCCGGAGGSATGGDVNTIGNAGEDRGSCSGAGGSAPSGGTGGAAMCASSTAGLAGTAPGAGGSGGKYSASPGSGGGSGGYVSKTYSAGALTEGSSISVTVGAGGAGADHQFDGGAGAAGRVAITWSLQPSCSVTAVTNPLVYGNSTTLNWSSSNANTSFYITNIGYVTPNISGSASVGPLSSTAYNGTAIGPSGTTNCNYTLTVGSPPTPSCALSVSPTSIVEEQSSTLSWSSSNTTSCTGVNFTTGGATSGSVAVSPSDTTTYTASCTGAGGTAQCSGTGPGGEGAALTVTDQCTPLTTYSCDGDTIVETELNAFCEEDDENLDTCELPDFCSVGSSVCITAAASGWINASPRLVPSGNTSTITWGTLDAESCTVSGNGNTWEDTTSGSGTSNPITEFTTYTIVCDDADIDTVQDDFEDSVFILGLPTWTER